MTGMKVFDMEDYLVKSFIGVLFYIVSAIFSLKEETKFASNMNGICGHIWFIAAVGDYFYY